MKSNHAILSALLVFCQIFLTAGHVLALSVDTTTPTPAPTPTPTSTVQVVTTTTTTATTTTTTATTTVGAIPTESDTVPPTILSVSAVSAEPTSMVVAWTTDELAYGKVEYGPTIAYGSSTLQSAVTSLEHAQTITGLTTGTKYYYRIVSTDSAGNITYSESHSLVTAAEQELVDNEPPAVSEIALSEISTYSVTMSIPTDELARVQVEYGTSENYGSVAYSGDAFSVDHEVSIQNLQANTTYHYRIVAEDESGNVYTSFDNEFITSPLPTVPVAASMELLAVTKHELVGIGTSTAKIIWETNKVADGELWYGIGGTDSVLPSPRSATTSHAVFLSGLTPETVYSYKIVSKTDSETATVEDLEFSTLPVAIQAVEKIILSSVAATKVGTSTAAVSWNTNLPGTSKLEYGTSTYEFLGYSAALVTSHTHSLAGLAQNAVYNFRVTSRDEAGNAAVSENYTFTTAPSSVSTNTPSAPVVPASPAVSTSSLPSTSTSSQTSQATPEAEETDTAVSVLPTPPESIPTPPPTAVYGGAKPPTPLPLPTLIKAEALDGQAVFFFNRPSEHHTTQVRVVRNDHFSPKHPKDGKIVYEGRAGSLVDKKLVNGQTYYYAIYGVDKYRGFSPPVLVVVKPKAGKTQSFLQATPSALPLTPKLTFPKDIFPGDAGRSVRHVQVLLAHDRDVYPEGLITGYFGKLTELALVRFQSKRKIPASGVVDAPTRKALEKFSGAQEISRKSFFYRNLSLGMQGADVVSLQVFLSAEGHYPEALFTGFFGPLTRSALTRFQKANTLAANGSLGSATREKIEAILKVSKTPASKTQ